MYHKMEAQITTLPTMGDMALFKGQLLEFHTQNVDLPCTLSRIRYLIDKSGGHKRHQKCVCRGIRCGSVTGLVWLTVDARCVMAQVFGEELRGRCSHSVVEGLTAGDVQIPSPVRPSPACY